MVTIQEIQIQNVFSFPYIHLHCGMDHFATIFNFSSEYNAENELMKAILPFFCKDVLHVAMNTIRDSRKTSSYVRIKFKIFTARSNDFVDAIRYSSKPYQIVYHFNGVQHTDSIHVFHQRCQFDISSYQFFKQIFLNENKNLLHNWVSGIWPHWYVVSMRITHFSSTWGVLNPVLLTHGTETNLEYWSDYIQKPKSQSQTAQLRIEKLTKVNVCIAKQCELLKKRTFVDIANEIGRIFKFVTFEQYNVIFKIPLSGHFQNVEDVKWENMELKNVEVFVKKTGQQSAFIWTELEEGLKHILKISQAIASAKFLKLKFLYLDDTTILQNYQNNEMIKEAILQKEGLDMNANWERTNFFKQIIKVCNEMKIMVFINYHGKMPLPPSNANIIRARCVNAITEVYLCTSLEAMSLDEFIMLFPSHGKSPL